MEEHPPPPGTSTSNAPGVGRSRRRNPLSIVLIAVIVICIVAAILLAGELYARQRAESMVAAAAECAVQDKASASFGATPLLLQLATGHYRNISIHAAGNRIGNARGMKADVRIKDVRLFGDAESMGTIGALDATISWSADGMKQSVQQAIPPLRGLVTSVQTHPDDGTIELQGNLGNVTTKPRVADGGVVLEVVNVTGLGLLVPGEMVQSALDAFTTHLTENYPLGIHADSVQITDDAITVTFSDSVGLKINSDGFAFTVGGFSFTIGSDGITVPAGKIKIGGIDFSTHFHGGVQPGTGVTTGPED